MLRTFSDSFLRSRFFRSGDRFRHILQPFQPGPASTSAASLSRLSRPCKHFRRILKPSAGPASTFPRILKPFSAKLYDTDIGKVAVALLIVQAVTDDELILNFKSDIINLHFLLPAGRLVEKCAEA